MQILIDTSVIIDYLRQKQKENTLLYRLVAGRDQPNISILTHTELYAGKSVWENKTALENLDKILSSLKIIPFTLKMSFAAGEIRSTHNIDLVDAIIAATAIEEKLPLFTLNKKHFEKIREIKLYKAIEE